MHLTPAIVQSDVWSGELKVKSLKMHVMSELSPRHQVFLSAAPALHCLPVQTQPLPAEQEKKVSLVSVEVVRVALNSFA